MEFHAFKDRVIRIFYFYRWIPEFKENENYNVAIVGHYLLKNRKDEEKILIYLRATNDYYGELVD